MKRRIAFVFAAVGLVATCLCVAIATSEKTENPSRVEVLFAKVCRFLGLNWGDEILRRPFTTPPKEARFNTRTIEPGEEK